MTGQWSLHFRQNWRVKAKHVDPCLSILFSFQLGNSEGIRNECMVVKFMVPFWIPIIIQHIIFRVPQKRGHDFDNHPNVDVGHLSCR